MLLSDLKDAGYIGASFIEVSFSKGVLPLNQALVESNRVTDSVAIVVDDCVWAATVKKVPVTKASTVYSCSRDGVIGCWKKRDKTFFLQEIVNDRLVTKNYYSFKEESGMDLEKLTQASVVDVTKEMEAFDKVPAADEKGKSDAAKKVEEIRNKLGQDTIAAEGSVVINNQKYGRALGFITKTNPVLKLSTKKVPKRDAQGNKIPNASAPADKIADFQKTGKLATKFCEVESVLGFTHAKPSKPIAMIIATPAGSDVSLTTISEKTAVSAKEDQTRKVHVISMESAYVYIGYNYGGVITEDDTILGNKATRLQTVVRAKVVTDADGTQRDGMTISLVPEKKEGVRSFLLTEGNYFPLKLYRTFSQQSMSAEQKVIANYNVEAALKGKELSNYSEETQQKITMLPDGAGFESTWFNGGEAIVVKPYDSKDADAVVTDVQIPVREKKETKDGGFTYKYVFDGLDDVEHGPLSKKIYKDIIALTKMSEDEFVKVASGFAKTSGGSRSNAAKLTVNDYLKAKTSRKVITDGTKSFFDMQQELEGLC